MRIGIINGPNLNLLGQREPGIYGKQNFDQYLELLRLQFSSHEIEFLQHNVEGELVNALHDFAGRCDGIVLNAAAYTHTSVALGDAVAAIDCPVVEVHISNVYQRESFRHHSYVSPHAAGIIVGLGLEGYRLALSYLLEKIQKDQL